MSDDLSFQIEIPTDDEGYVLLQCPNCGTYFKVTAVDAEDEGILEIFCPSCGLVGETYLTADAIDLAQAILYNKAMDNITVHKGQVNIANDNAQLTATSTVGVEADQLDKLIRAIKDAARDLSPEDQELLNDNLDVIQADAGSDKPRKGFLKIAINGLKAIKGSVEFGAAVSSLLQFAEMMQWIVL